MKNMSDIKNRNKRRIAAYFCIGLLLFGFSMQMGWLTIFGINPIVLGAIPGLEPDDVFFKVNVKESLGAYAAEDIIVNAYTKDGGTFTYFDSATASSGIATFSGTSIPEGSHIWLQARQAAPATADGYITPAREFIVGIGDPTDTVSVKDAITGESTLWVNNLHDSTEPVFTFYAPDTANLASGSVDNLTSADLYFTMNIYIAEDECWYGAPDFTDLVDGKQYIGGIWITMSGATDYTFEQGAARHYMKWSVGSVIYHAWNYDVRLWQDSLRTGDVNSVTFTQTLAVGADFDQGADTLTLDVYDMMLNPGGMGLINPSNANFVDGGALDPSAVTAYVD